MPLVVALTGICVWSADLIALGMKAVADRPRPFETVPRDDPIGVLPASSSLPSGHAATAFAGAVVLSYVLPRAAPFLAVLALAIAYSRVYLGVHYLSDVAAGGALGATVAAAAILALRRPLRLAESLRPRPRARPPG